MKLDVAPEDLITWSTALGEDPTLLRRLASLARQFGSEAGAGAPDTPDLAATAGELAVRLDTVLATLADALDSLRSRLAGGSGAYATTEGFVSRAIGASGG